MADIIDYHQGYLDFTNIKRKKYDLTDYYYFNVKIKYIKSQPQWAFVIPSPN